MSCPLHLIHNITYSPLLVLYINYYLFTMYYSLSLAQQYFIALFHEKEVKGISGSKYYE